MPPTDLGQLLDRAARGDAEAFAEFYDATIAGAYRLARLTLANHARTDQVVHDAYLRAWRELDQVPVSGRSPQAWLMGLIQDAARTAPRPHVRSRRGGRHRGPAAPAALP